MKLSSNVRYSHPVIDELNGDFEKAVFSCEIALKDGLNNDNGILEFEYQCSIDQQDIIDLIENDLACIKLMIECGNTFYRRLENIKTGGGRIELDVSKVYKTVEITPVIYANDVIANYSPVGAHPEYGNAQFRVRAGDALAIAPTQRYSVDVDKHNYLESVFWFVTNDNLEDYELELDTTDSENIQIGANSFTREFIESFRTSNEQKKILLNAVYLPVIVGVVADMTKDMSSDTPSLEGRRWYEAFMEVAEQNNFTIDKDSVPLDIAQRILKYPLRSLATTQSEDWD